jgi:hypothetical protein
MILDKGIMAKKLQMNVIKEYSEPIPIFFKTTAGIIKMSNMLTLPFNTKSKYSFHDFGCNK